MKFLVAVTLIASLAVLCQGEALSKEERTKKLELLAKKCQENEKATDADYQETLDQEVPSTETGRCLRACIFESVGALQGVNFDLDTLAALTEKKTDDSILQNVLKEVSAECAPLAADSNRCDLAGKFILCFHDKLTARGYDPKKINDQ